MASIVSSKAFMALPWRPASRLGEPAVELLAKLPHLLRRLSLKTAQKAVEIDLRHTSILHCRLALALNLADSATPVSLAGATYE